VCIRRKGVAHSQVDMPLCAVLCGTDTWVNAADTVRVCCIRASRADRAEAVSVIKENDAQFALAVE